MWYNNNNNNNNNNKNNNNNNNCDKNNSDNDNNNSSNNTNRTACTWLHIKLLATHDYEIIRRIIQSLVGSFQLGPGLTNIIIFFNF